MTTLTARVVPVPARVLGRGGGRHIVERNFLLYRRSWIVFLSGFFEPLFYLLSIGIGVAQLVGDFTLSDGTTIGYAAFVAPAMLASSAMNGAIFDSTYNIFFRMKYAKLYDSMLATPLRPWDIATGEVTWALLRGACYSAMFIAVMLGMGLITSWWALLALPASVLIAFAFAGAGMALTTFMRSWQDFEFVQLAAMPMFLFSATFYPVETYPEAIRWLVEITPLYQGVVIERALTTGTVGWFLLVHAFYLAAMGTIGMYIASQRLGKLLLK
ncbi:ABC transporter permease [Kribbella sp. NPDC050281]|uniref:ABC transporter permease n=1 Tax=Kribbella sp. NPDC050281 TaxID=3155515 RepID=UPI00340F01C6